MKWFTERFRTVAGSIRKNRSDWIAACSLVVAIIALIITVNPKIIPWNRNHIERANAGDIYSQMFLAEHYFEIGDYGEAIYWYKIASVEPSKYQAYAYNNLGYLYAEGFGLSDYENEGYRRLEMALNLFIEASEQAVRAGTTNTRILLSSNNSECFPNINYEEMLEEFECNGSYVSSSSYEKLTTYRGTQFWDGNIQFRYLGTAVELTQNDLIKTVYCYYVQTYSEEFDRAKLQFVYLEDLENMK